MNPDAIPGLNASVVRAADRNRLFGYVTAIKEGKALGKRESDDFAELFERFRDDKPAAGGAPVDPDADLLALINSPEALATGTANGREKLNKFQKDVATELVARWFMRGKVRAWIVVECEKRWGYGRGAADKMLKAARERVADAARVPRIQLRGIVSQVHMATIARAAAAGDNLAVTRSLEALAKLHGLNEPEQFRSDGSLSIQEFEAEMPRAIVSLPDDGSGVTS